MEILVTGGRGFIGKHLCRHLALKGNRIISVDKKNYKHTPHLNHINEIQLDITKDIDKLDKLFKNGKIEMIYHLASNTSIPIGQTNITVDLTDTFESTLVMLRMAVKYNVRGFVFTSSSTVYGKCDVKFSEDTSIFKPISNYGAAKLASEGFINAYCHVNNIKSWIIRCGNIIGEDSEHGVIYDLCRKIEKKEQVIYLLGDGNQEKPFLYIDDFIRGLDCIVNNATEDHCIYLLGNDSTTSLKKIAIIAENIHPHIRIMWDNLPTWNGDVTNYVYDISKIKALGWKPTYTSDEAVSLSLKKYNYNGRFI